MGVVPQAQVAVGDAAFRRNRRSLEHQQAEAAEGEPAVMDRVAAPGHFRDRVEPATIAELLAHDCLRQRYSVGGRLYDWRFADRGQTVHIDVQGRLIFDEMRAVLDAAIQGRGIAFVLEKFAQQELESGVLRHILTPHWGMDDTFHLYYPHREHMPGKLRAFVDFMRAATSPAIEQTTASHPNKKMRR